MLVIELDGKIHDKPEVKILDEQRESELRNSGYEVIRFTNQELFQKIKKVLQTIKKKVEELNQPSRSGAQVLLLGRI